MTPQEFLYPLLFPIKRDDFRTFTPSAFHLAERFWRHVDKSPGCGPQGECWVWTGQLHDKGYGWMELACGRRRSLFRAHRLSWLLHIGEIPLDQQVLHRCDNPPCVRPDHLFLGDSHINWLDAVSKGRRARDSRGFCRGESFVSYLDNQSE